MYESHWNLNSRPFENRHDASYYYPSESHQAALLKLRYAVENRRGATVLCGMSGMGKTLILQSLSEQLPEFVSTFVSINYPAMDADQLIRTMALRLAGSGRDSRKLDVAESISLIDEVVAEHAKHEKQIVIAIDEAQLLEQYNLIEPIRLLLNLGAQSKAGESSITLILCGQSTLLPHVQRNISLDERIAVRCILNRFALDETAAYIGHRIRSSEGQVERIFEPSALETIHGLTQGVPRRINRLCDLALMVGYAQEASRIDSQLIEEVHSELTTPSLSID